MICVHTGQRMLNRMKRGELLTSIHLLWLLIYHKRKNVTYVKGLELP